MKNKHRGYWVASGYGAYLLAPGVPAGRPLDVEKRWRVVLAGNNVVPGRIVASCIDHLSASAAALLLAGALAACGGSPFTTLEAASLASGDDAAPLEDQKASAHPDDGGGSSRDGGGEEKPTTDPEGGSLEAGPDSPVTTVDASEAGAPALDAGADVHDGALPMPDAPADGPKGLCCRTEVNPGCSLAWVPYDAGAVNDYCSIQGACVTSGVVVPCP